MDNPTKPNVIHQYSVLPFSAPNYKKNFSKLKPLEYGCAICGKPVAYPYERPVVVVHGGDWAQTPEEEADTGNPGYMGVWGVGPDCHRKYLVVKEKSKP